MTAAPAEIRITLPRLHAGQLETVRHSKRFNVIVCGRRWGKSVLGIERIVHPALAGFPVAYYSPTHKMLTEVWREVTRLLGPVVERRSSQEHRLELMTGGIVDMWSLDGADTSRGRKYKLVVIDEAAMVADLRDVWHAVIRPTLADYRGGAWFLSTPKGMNGFFDLYQTGMDPEQREWSAVQMPTTANPYISADEIEAARQGTPSDLYRQEYEAAFISHAGTVFRNLDACLTLTPSTPEAHAGHRIVMGIDWGQVQDFTVISVVCATCRQEVALDRFNKIDYDFQRGRLETLVGEWHPADVLGEENSIGKPIITSLYNAGIPIRGFSTTAQSKGPLVQSMALALEREEMHWLADPVARRELLSYEAKINPLTNRVSYSAPKGQHDDTVIARCLALKAALEPRPAFDWT